MRRDPSPNLVVIAGPNGSGKTEFTHEALRHKWLMGCKYVNPDEIANDIFGDWNDRKAVLAAIQHAEKIRMDCIDQRRSLAFETVFSTREKIDFVKSAQAAGFFVRFFFIGTDKPEINAARIVKRVEQGGHEVPIRKIVSRYYKSMTNLARILPLVDRGYVYDNSIDNAPPALQFRTKNGRVEKVYANSHDWADMACKAISKNFCSSATDKPECESFEDSHSGAGEHSRFQSIPTSPE